MLEGLGRKHHADRPAEVARELLTHSGSQFDRRVVEAFLEVLAEHAELSRRVAAPS